MSETIASAYVQILPSTDGIKGNLESALGGEAQSAGKSAGAKFGSAFGTATKIGVGAVTALGTAAVGAGTALYKGIDATSQYGDEIDKMSQKLGVSAKTYQEYDYVMKLAGTSMQDMGTGLKTLTNKLQTAKDGSDKSIEMFKQLGLSMEDLNSMSREDVFKNVITGLQGMEDSTERAALANSLFGKSGQNLTPLFNQTAQETQNLIKNLNDMGSVMSDDAVKSSADFQDALTTMATAFDGVKNKAASSFMPAVTEIIEGITDLATGADGADEKLQNGISMFTDGLINAIPKFVKVFETISSAIIEVAPDLLKSLADGLISALPQIIPQLTQLVIDIGKKLIELFPQLAECAVQLILELANGITESLPTLIPAIVDVVLMIVDTLIDNVDLLVDGAIALVVGLAEGIINALPKLIEKAPEIVIKLAEAIIRNAPKILVASVQLIAQLAKGILTAIPSLVKAGADIVAGLWNGIKNAWSTLVTNIKGLASGLVQTIKSVLMIGSPSKIMRDEVGKWIPEGIAVGIDATADSPIKALDSMSDDMTTTLQSQIASDVSLSPVYSSTSAEVANNDTQGLFDLMSQYFPQMANQAVNISLEGDAAGLFNAVRKENSMFSKANGRSAFA